MQVVHYRFFICLQMIQIAHCELEMRIRVESTNYGVIKTVVIRNSDVAINNFLLFHIFILNDLE